MKRNRKLKPWHYVFVVLGILLALFIPQINKVSAFDDLHVLYVLFRVETEIMQKSHAGRYYESLFWKHNDELIQLRMEKPETYQQFMKTARMFTSGLEALVNGNGDFVRITEEQVSSLKVELERLASIGSPELREDIQREQEHMPLETFVGMTMTEALDYINSTWTPSSNVEKTSVPGSSGEWSYYILNGIYVEYPSDWIVQSSVQQKDTMYVLPGLESPEGEETAIWKIHIRWNLPPQQRNRFDFRNIYSSDTQWETKIILKEFQGSEVLLGSPIIPIMGLYAFLYNEEHQFAVETMALIRNVQIYNAIDYSRMIDQKHPYYQRMIKSIRIIEVTNAPPLPTTPIPTATPTP